MTVSEEGRVFCPVRLLSSSNRAYHDSVKVKKLAIMERKGRNNCMRVTVCMISGVATGGGTWVHASRRSWKLAFVSGFWGFASRPPPGLYPWTPLGDFRPQTPSFVPRSKFLATPLCMRVMMRKRRRRYDADVLTC